MIKGMRTRAPVQVRYNFLEGCDAVRVQLAVLNVRGTGTVLHTGGPCAAGSARSIAAGTATAAKLRKGSLWLAATAWQLAGLREFQR